MSTQIQAIGNFNADEIEVMQHTLAVGTTPQQFGLFIRTAVASGLNPFLNHIYCIVYGGKMSIQVSVEGILYLAKRVEGYEGIDTQLVHENDEFEAYIDKDGRWVIGEHKIKFPRGKVLACYSIAYRTGFRPFTVFIEADEVQHHLSGTNAGNWKKYYNDFFKKTASKRSAKGQFGIEISEDDSDGNSSDVSSYERKDITNEATPLNTQPAKPDPKTESKQPAKTPPDDSGLTPIDEEKPDLVKEKTTKVVAELKRLGYSTKPERDKYIDRKLEGKQLTETNIDKLLGMIALDIEDMEEANRTEDGDGLPEIQ
jgi:recombination protein RecT